MVLVTSTVTTVASHSSEDSLVSSDLRPAGVFPERAALEGANSDPSLPSSRTSGHGEVGEAALESSQLVIFQDDFHFC